MKISIPRAPPGRALVNGKGRWLGLEGVSISLSVDGGYLSEIEVVTGEDGTARLIFSAPDKKGEISILARVIGTSTEKSKIIKVNTKL